MRKAKGFLSLFTQFSHRPYNPLTALIKRINKENLYLPFSLVALLRRLRAVKSYDFIRPTCPSFPGRADHPPGGASSVFVRRRFVAKTPRKIDQRRTIAPAQVGKRDNKWLGVYKSNHLLNGLTGPSSTLGPSPRYVVCVLPRCLPVNRLQARCLFTVPPCNGERLGIAFNPPPFGFFPLRSG